ncbi:hypothetical protein DFJ74DRAFT_760513 [Hyaloraphidium curvatum]|nr:hypothetical protein DFJ74DRAFT_760513 [Hyaloraphidium curvatum]
MTAGTVYGMPLEPTELTTPGTTYLLRQSALPQGPEAYLRLLALRNLLEDPLSVSDLQHCLKLLVGFSMEDYGARAHESQQAKTGLAIWVVAAALSPLLVLAATIIAVPEGVIGAKSVASFFLFAVGGAGVAALDWILFVQKLETEIWEVNNSLGRFGETMADEPPEPSALVHVSGLTPDFVPVRLRGVGDEAALRAAVGRDARLPAAYVASLELRRAGPLRPAVPGSDAVWETAEPLPPWGRAFAWALAGTHLVGRVGGRRFGPPPSPPPIAPQRPDANSPIVWVMLREGVRWCAFRVPVRGCVCGMDIKAAFREQYGLDARTFGTLELRCVGYEAPPLDDRAREAAWQAGAPVEDDTPFPDRARGLDWDSRLIARTYRHPVGPEHATAVHGGLAEVAASAAAAIRSWVAPLFGTAEAGIDSGGQ